MSDSCSTKFTKENEATKIPKNSVYINSRKKPDLSKVVMNSHRAKVTKNTDDYTKVVKNIDYTWSKNIKYPKITKNRSECTILVRSTEYRQRVAKVITNNSKFTKNSDS